MYVRIGGDRRGTDNVRRVTIEGDDGSKIVVTEDRDAGEPITVAIHDGTLAFTHTGTLGEWSDAAWSTKGISRRRSS